MDLNRKNQSPAASPAPGVPGLPTPLTSILPSPPPTKPLKEKNREDVKNPLKLRSKIKPDLSLIFFIIVLLINLLLTGVIIKLLPHFLTLRNLSLTQSVYVKEGISEEKLKNINNLNLSFPAEKRVIEIVSEINKVNGMFESYSFNFDTDEPKIAEAKYLPFTINAVGTKQAIFNLLSSLTSAKEAIIINNFEITESGRDNKDLKELLLKANLYIADRFSY